MSDTYPAFVRAQGAQLRKGDVPPPTLPAWMKRRLTLIGSLRTAMGAMPAKPGDLAPRVIGTIKRKGYRIEKLLLQTRPGVEMPANFFLPEATGKVPAVLCVHGHAKEARRDPGVQARCVGLAKLGFAVLSVDAFGAGERHPVIRSGSYHGALLGASLWPAGLTLLGVQVYDNRRAVDYLLTRPEIDGERIGITGASGGGNQTMNAGAADARLRAVVPVCSVGNYQAYLRAACCVCEVLPGALRFTEEGDVLGLVAPRALMVISATKDSYQFSVGEAKKSLARARAIYALHRKEDRLSHVLIESGHAYNQPMREAMYGWMLKHLAGKGDGKPVPEPTIELEKVADLACYPDGKRPKTFLFPPSLAAQEAGKRLARFDDKNLDHKEAWEAVALGMHDELARVLGPMPALPSPKKDLYPLNVEEGIRLPGEVRKGGKRSVLLLHLDGKEAAFKHPLATALKDWDVHSFDLRATGSLEPKSNRVRTTPDHNSAEHAVWIGRPLLGQWLADLRAWLAVNGPAPVVGIGQAGVLALLSDAPSVAALGVLSSFVTPTGFADGTRMGLLVPNLFLAGDIPHLAALRAPRKTLIAGSSTPEGKPLDKARTGKAFAFTRKAYGLMKTPTALRIEGEMMPADIAKWLGS